MAAFILDAERAREALHYDPNTGEFTRKLRTAQCHQVGDRADLPGRGNLAGYRTIGLNGSKWLAHRVAWLYVHGRWPENQIDHINGVASDNRIINLRDVSGQMNAQNKRKAMKANPSGLLGAAWCEPNKKYRARIQIGERFIHIGMFSAPESAHAAYLAAKRKYHEGCTI